MRGRYLLGLSNANRQAAGVMTGEEVEVEVEIDAEPRVVVEPADFARALDADPVARTAYDRLSYGRKREHVLAIESAKTAETTHAADREGPGGAPGPGVGSGPFRIDVDQWRVVDCMIRRVRHGGDCGDHR